MKRLVIGMLGIVCCLTMCVTTAMATTLITETPEISVPKKPSDILKVPELAEEVAIVEGECKELELKKKGWKIIKVISKTKDDAVATVSFSDSKLRVTGISPGTTEITTKIKAKKNGEKKTFTLKTTATVISVDESIGTPIEVLVADNGKDFLKLLKENKGKHDITIAYISKETEDLVIPKDDYRNITIIIDNPNNDQENNARFASIIVNATKRSD